MNKNILLISALFTSFFSSTTWALDASQLINRTLLIEGQNSKYGPYTAQIEIREEAQGLNVIKDIHYKNYSFENLQIEEIWTGKAVLNANGNLQLDFDLKKADVLDSAEGESRTESMFKERSHITETLTGGSLLATRNDETFTENLVGVKEISSQPLWENKRTRTESVGTHGSTLERLALGLLELKTFNWFHSDEKVKAFENRPEYQSRKQYFIYDFSDYDFYQNNKNTLRLVNKIPDKISLIEEKIKYNAFAYTLDEKGKHFDEDMKDYHINELGIFSHSVFDDQQNFVGYSMDGDASLWTGMYVGSQAMRYKVTKDPAALKNLEKSVNGLMLLMDITGDSHQFARSVHLDNGLVPVDSEHIRGTGPYKNMIWLTRGNNDMFKGIVHGFIWAYQIVPASEKEFRARLLDHMNKLTELTVAQDRNNLSIASGLKALATHNEIDKRIFTKNYNLERSFYQLTNLEGASYLGGIADWSGINLSMVGNITQYLIADALLRDFPSNDQPSLTKEKDLLLSTQKNLLYSWKDLIGTRSDSITITAKAFAVDKGVSPKAVNELRDGQTRKSLEQNWDASVNDALGRLKEIPIKRSEYTTHYNYFWRDGWSISWWPTSPWKSVTKKQTIEYHMQGAISYPLYEGNGIGDNFIWKSGPFDIVGGSNKNEKMPGTDYLYVYWMAKYANMIK